VTQIQHKMIHGEWRILTHSQIKSITVSPDPPVPGKNLTVNVEADVQDAIEVGQSGAIRCLLAV
jgi:hypothetical protein